MDWLNYHHLHYFWMIVKEGGFLRAAEKLRVSQSALSHQVKKLEEQFGTPLFDRESKRTLKLTEAGRRTFEHAEAIFQRGRALQAWARGGAQGGPVSVRIGAVGSLSKNFQFLFLREFLRDENVTLQVRTGEIESLLHDMKNRELDFIISNMPAPPSAKPFVVNQELARSPYVLAGTAKYAGLKRRFPHSLYGQPVYRLMSPSGAHLHFERILDGLDVKASYRGDIEAVALLRLIGLSGDGLIFLPEVGIARDLSEKSLIALKRFKDVRESFYLILRSELSLEREFESTLAKAVQSVSKLRALN